MTPEGPHLQAAFLLLALATLVIWVYLVAARGGYWRVWRFDADGDSRESPNWPSVAAIVPARNEAATVGATIESLLGQDYPGAFSIVLVDDHSDDGTAAIARHAARERGGEARVTIHQAAPLPDAWTGKVWAMNEGVACAAQAQPLYYWLTDADIIHAPNTLRRLVARAERDHLDLASLMVFLRCSSLAERFLIPSFLYFFLKLYPPRWIANPAAKTAGAAGGCILLRRDAFERIGGFSAIRAEVIEDCALAGKVKRSGGRTWLGLTRASRSIRGFDTHAEIQQMIARTAFTKLRHSSLLLAGTLVGIFLTYLAPVALLLAPVAFVPMALVRALALAAWLLMTISFLPTTRFYRLSPLWAMLLPLAALFYAYATFLSAVRYWLGCGGHWKGRSQARTLRGP